jgi:hypothetical protein
MMQHFLVQLFLAALALAAPIAEETVAATAGGNAWQYGTGGGILGLIVLILDIIVFGSCIFPQAMLAQESASPNGCSVCSRSHKVQPSSFPQVALVALGVHIPDRGADHLLAVLQPRGT